MSKQTKHLLLEGINALCYGLIVVICCAVMAFSTALISFANVIQIL